MKKLNQLAIAILATCYIQFSAAQSTAWQRANSLGKGVSFSLWLESSYPFFCSPVNYPDNTLFTRETVKQAKDMCFQTIRVPVMFEAYDIISNPVDPRVMRGLAQLDSVLAWGKEFGMNIIVDNHIADDIILDPCGNNLQALYGITDANYSMKAFQTGQKWKDIVTRLAYTDPNHVFFELRNEPNVVSDANTHIFYQTVIDTLRKYDPTHTYIVGNSEFYDIGYLAASQPYADNNIIYAYHTYTPWNEVNQGDTGYVAGNMPVYMSYPNSSHIAAIKNEFNLAKSWSVAHNLPVFLGEFGSRTYANTTGHDSDRCLWIKTFGEMLDSTKLPWSYWDYNTYSEDYNGKTHARFGIFNNPTDNPTMNDSAHIYTCFRDALHIGSACAKTTGIHDLSSSTSFSIHPNPTAGNLKIQFAEKGNLEIFNTLGELVLSQIISENTTSIPTSNLPTGFYFIKVQNEHGIATTKSFIKE